MKTIFLITCNRAEESFELRGKWISESKTKFSSCLGVVCKGKGQLGKSFPNLLLDNYMGAAAGLLIFLIIVNALSKLVKMAFEYVRSNTLLEDILKIICGAS